MNFYLNLEEVSILLEHSPSFRNKVAKRFFSIQGLSPVDKIKNHILENFPSDKIAAIKYLRNEGMYFLPSFVDAGYEVDLDQHGALKGIGLAKAKSIVEQWYKEAGF